MASGKGDALGVQGSKAGHSNTEVLRMVWRIGQVLASATRFWAACRWFFC